MNIWGNPTSCKGPSLYYEHRTTIRNTSPHLYKQPENIENPITVELPEPPEKAPHGKKTTMLFGSIRNLAKHGVFAYKRLLLILTQLYGLLLKKKHINIESISFICLCALWYLSSAVTNNIGKIILNQFDYPMTLTYFQFGIVAVMCSVIKPFVSKDNPIDLTKNVIQDFKGAKHYWFFICSLTKRKAFRTCMPLSLFQICTHICNSYATEAIPVSFVHTIKALSPLFTVLCYRVFWSVDYSKEVYASLIPLTFGVMTFCYGSLSLNAFGISCSLVACFIFVIQSILTKKYLFKSKKFSQSLTKIDILFYSSVYAFIIMFPIWWLFDGKQLFLSWQLNQDQPDPSKPLNLTVLSLYFLLSGVSQCAQAILSFTLLSQTDAVTFSVFSQMKRVVIILSAMIYFGQPMNLSKAVGLIMVVFGLWAYDKAKRQDKPK